MSAVPRRRTWPVLLCVLVGVCDLACFRPIHGFRSASGEFVSSARKGVVGDLTVPCGRCIGCRVARARMWSLRCVHEASLHPANCFVTLTYSDDKLPPGGSLCYRDFQLFVKRLRKHYSGTPVRYFVCGEYGEQLSRPHYHACLFGLNFFEDREPVLLLSGSTHTHYRSATLERLWGLGFVDITDLNVRTAGYAARYILKKVTGDLAESHYSRVSPDGVISSVAPEFARMSVRPGLGADWFSRFGADVASGDSIVHDGRQYPVPPYYDRLRKRSDELGLAEVKAERELRAYRVRSDSTPRRLADREKVAAARLSTLLRVYEK